MTEKRSEDRANALWPLIHRPYHWGLQISPWAAVIMIATLLALIPIGFAGWLLGILIVPIGIIAAAIVQGMYSPKPRSGGASSDHPA